MIESITIAGTAPFGSTPVVLNGLSQFNFVFGSNGTGKTTISRIVAEEANWPSCRVTWKGGTRLQAMVYNRDFIQRNFNQSADLKGVFTLGERRVETLNKIAECKTDIDALTKRIENLTNGLHGDTGTGGKKGELEALEAGLRRKCWEKKQEHDARLHRAFEGFRGSQEKFKDKIIQEWKTNVAALVPLTDLENKAATVFASTPTFAQPIPSVDSKPLVAHEANPLLKKRIIGKEDVDIAAMIRKLGNSDWVREGRAFYQMNDSMCPFCQQSTTARFAQNLNEYFDETFVKESKAVDDLATNYLADATRIQQQIASMIATPPQFIDVEKLIVEKELFDSKVTLNIRQIATKQKEPSQAVELESTNDVLAAIKAMVDNANACIVEHNEMVANLAQERSTLTAQVWKYVLEELKSDLAAYKTARENLEKAIAAMKGQIAAATTEKAKKIAEIRELEKQATSVQPTSDAINALLSSFGFQSFKLARAADGTSYKLVRANGSDAKATLSEGERTFVTFLYFYHLLKGSNSDSGMTTDRVVVFDDPVSSLDSEVLFVVGSLIKGLFDEVRTGTGHIKQVFVLTHNVYFHKEVTFNPKRRHNVAMSSEETFWTVRKSDLFSKVEKHNANPVRTSYELLWAEVRRPDRSKLTIQNTLRRILENYFRILGGVDPDDICGMFEGREKLICKSLFSWVNDGSHYAHDDLYLSIDDGMVETYLKVFKAIFEKAKHSGHYDMMMADASVGSPYTTASV